MLQAIVDRRAREVVLDLMGVDEVDVQTELFGRIVRAVQLLGASVTICCADMQAALAAVR